ncbi:MAG: 3-methyl-2-oxobutanoate hydroxymethyltransferase [Candidatus Omnitrophica bacterium]|nr:3-methyl-2-oxobutanoate hydroxymethyltransferase [Candidatus Omnitrophota bacterium]MCF7894607.1 3-methyl-2-oxobutanoate hydroxymethyltransferase [Candidatus Omnitrophota bacterium]
MKKNNIKIKQVMAGEKKISIVTCYDYSFARILNQSVIDIILVGDSLANVSLGLADTKEITIEEMLNHTKAVSRGAPDKIIIADIPYSGCQKKSSQPLEIAKRLIQAGADGIKIEWFKGCKKVIRKLVEKNIWVMGHIGLTPQTVHLLGGYKVQGKDKESADKLIKQAKLLQGLGVSSIVLECIKKDIAKQITESIDIPTIGIGAGKHCGGQVLVLYDLLGMYPNKMKFVRTFSNLSYQIKGAINLFDQAIKKETFPSNQESF